MLRKLLLSFAFSATALFATAQDRASNTLTKSEIENMTWVEAMQDYRVNFHTVVDKFESEFAGKPYEKGHGWKQFKRWEYMMGQRVGETGVRPHPSVLYNAIQSQLSSNEYGDWRPAGPFNAPSGDGIGRINNVAFHPQHNDTIYAGAPAGGLWVSYDDGQTWQTFTDELTNIGVSDLAIDPQHPDTMYLATGDRDAADTYSFGLMKSVDGGVTWSATGLSFNVSNNYRIGRVVVHPDSTNIVVAATNGGIYRSTNYGQTFSLEQSGLFYGVHMGHGDTLFATTSGSSPKVYRSVNAGDTWTQMSSGLPTSGVYRCEVAVSSVPGLLYAVFGDSNYGFGGLYRSTNGGSNWSLMSSTPNIMGWSSTGGGSGGQAWYDLSIACDPLNENTIYVGGVNIWKSTNGGANWSIVGHWYGAGSIPYVHADHHHASFRPGTSQLYVGTDGGVYKTANGGTSWSHLNDGMNITQYYKISQSTSDTTVILAGAQDNGSHLRSSSSWSRVTGGDGMDNGVDVTNDNIMYTSIYYGDFYKSTNGGGFFSAINTLSASGSGNWVTPFNVDPVNGNTIYAGFTKLWKSTNAGASWTATSSSNVSGGSNIDEFEIAPSNTNYIYVLVNSNIFKSTNGGSTWSNITPSGGLSPSPHNISGVAIDPDDEQHIVISISGYTSNKKVMESFNGGQTWSNLSSGLPNIPANCVTFESGSSDGIYVGTDIGVYYHSSAFSNWVSYNKNLPNVIVVDFEIYEDDDLLRIGTYGRGVWQSPLMAGSAAPPVAAFMADPAAPCGTTDTISLIDQSQGLTTSWQWQISPSTFSYVNGTTDSSQSPQVIFSATGGYTVTLTATNAYGSDDTTVFQAISVGGAALPFVEDFENGLNGWEIDNPDGGITWASTTVNGTSPGTTGMFMNHYSYSGSGQRDELISPALDFSNDTLVSMSFEYASAYYSSGYSDSLLVYVSDDCGATWTEVAAYDATDASFTTAGAITSSFAPADSTYWCHGSSSVTCPTIDLDAYSGMSGIRVKFVAVNGYGNNTFLDNINISGQAQVAPVAAFGGDTAACTGKSVTFYDYSAPAPTARLWS
ncbi:MAG: PKD domain-containing protein, partial [Schleiferiaceae bacterium]